MTAFLFFKEGTPKFEVVDIDDFRTMRLLQGAYCFGEDKWYKWDHYDLKNLSWLYQKPEEVPTELLTALLLYGVNI